MKIRSISLLALLAGAILMLAVYFYPENAEANKTNYLATAPTVRVTLEKKYAHELIESGAADFLITSQTFSGQFIGFEGSYSVFSLGGNNRLVYLIEKQIILMEMVTY